MHHKILRSLMVHVFCPVSVKLTKDLLGKLKSAKRLKGGFFYVPRAAPGPPAGEKLSDVFLSPQRCKPNQSADFLHYLSVICRFCPKRRPKTQHKVGSIRDNLQDSFPACTIKSQKARRKNGSQTPQRKRRKQGWNFDPKPCAPLRRKMTP